ncbi:hypothetical protein [Streptomyces sp. NPDC020965]|uniref:hypothetical protein n=1 Tax=Streptomyces sp. NPDC020965 TaxID=3365105 RepID=UPI0037ADEC86
MADHGRTARRRVRMAGLALAAVLLTPVLLAGCAAPEASDTVVRDIRRTLDARADAAVARDEKGYLAALAPDADALRVEERRQFRHRAKVPLASWEYRLGKVERRGDTAVADAELRYRLTGYDTVPVTAARTLELGRYDGRWYVRADRAAKGGPQQLWQQGDVQVVHGTRSLVLAVGQDEDRLRALAARADRTVPTVSAAWPSPWARKVVVLVPESLEAMGALLGAPATGYRGIAAVTTGETGTAGRVPADRVIVNPSAYGVLGDFGQEIVLTHETAHVATRAYTSGTTPMWLSEGFADWVAYRDTGRTAAQTAPGLHRAIREGDVPARLPADDDFAFGGEPDALAKAYEGGWLACELIAERWGEERLTALYRAAGDGTPERAIREVLGTTSAAFTSAWREYLGTRLG